MAERRSRRRPCARYPIGSKCSWLAATSALPCAIPRVREPRLGGVRATAPSATLLKWLAPEVSLIVLDVSRAEDDAFDVLQQIRARRPKLPVILTSRAPSLVGAVRAVEAGAFDHLPKPYEPVGLVAIA